MAGMDFANIDWGTVAAQACGPDSLIAAKPLYLMWILPTLIGTLLLLRRVVPVRIGTVGSVFLMLGGRMVPVDRPGWLRLLLI